MLAGEREFFIPFKEYPGFTEASVNQISNFIFIPPSQLRWESLDIALFILQGTIKKPVPLEKRVGEVSSGVEPLWTVLQTAA